MSTWQWILVVVGGWIALALVTALLLGRIIRNAERQRTRPEHPEVQIPEQRQGPKPRRRPQQWPLNGK